MVRVYVQQLCEVIGVSEEAACHTQNNAGYLTRGSIAIEVFMKSYETVRKQETTFIRFVSLAFKLLQELQRLLELYNESAKKCITELSNNIFEKSRPSFISVTIS